VGLKLQAKEKIKVMGLNQSIIDKEGRDETPTKRDPELVNIKLSCTDFGHFNGRSDQWIAFKENTLSKAGVGGYAQFFKPDFIVNDATRDGNQRIFYLLQNAMNGGEASHIIRKHIHAAYGHAAWQSLLVWYEGPVMSGEISKTLRSKLWTLQLQSKGDANKHINDFTLYMDQLRELGREEREETLTDLFLDSILDPRYSVTIANCQLRDHISIHECFEAIRKYENIIVQESIMEGMQLHARCTNHNVGKTPSDNLIQTPQSNHQNSSSKSKVHTGYRTYKEWIKLTPEQCKEVLQQCAMQKQDNPSTNHVRNLNDDAQDKKWVTFNPQEPPRKLRRTNTSTIHPQMLPQPHATLVMLQSIHLMMNVNHRRSQIP
jgi:hypothetical protein